MDKYIKLEPLLKELEENTPYNWSDEDYEQGEVNGYKYAVSIIEAQDTADVVEVVRCKNCKFWTKMSDSAQGRCLLSEKYPTGEWYCANGRSEDKKTMAEYIERERLVKHYENCIDEVKNTNGIAEDFEICLKALKAQPAAEVAEVKHSEWHCSSVSMKTRNITCRHCRRTETISNGRTNFDFCPNCGARMDGEGG